MFLHRRATRHSALCTKIRMVVLREHCLAHRTPGLNFKSKDNLSALEPSDPGPTYIRKCRVLPFRSASVKSKFSIVVENDVILNPYFHSPGSNRGTGNSSCLRKSPSTTCSSFTAQASERFGGDCGIGTTDFPLGVSEREQGISTNVTEREHGFPKVSRNENKVSHSMSRDENIDVCSVWSLHGTFRVTVASRVPDHRSPLPAICETCTAALIILWSVLRETSRF